MELTVESYTFVGLCLALGLISGFLGGLLGIGGGVVIVPVLAFYYEASLRFAPSQSLLVAVATALCCIVFTSLSAAYTQYRAGKIRWDIARAVVLFLMFGGLLAGLLAPAIPEQTFRVFIGCFFCFVAAVMLSSWQPHPTRHMPGRLGSAGLGTGVGLVAGMAGIAGGNLLVPSFVYFNTPIHNATATSSALGVPIATMGALGYVVWAPNGAPFAASGYIDLRACAPIIVGALIAAPLGVRLAHRVPANRLKQGFGVLLLVVAGRLFYSALT